MTDAVPDQGKRPQIGPGETARGRLQRAVVPSLLSIIGLILVLWLTFVTVSFNSRFTDLREDLRRDLDDYGGRIQHLERIQVGGSSSN